MPECIGGPNGAFLPLVGMNTPFMSRATMAAVSSPPEALDGRARKKRALRTTALELTQERGPAGVHISEIAERAGVSTRTFFDYFAKVRSRTASPARRRYRAGSRPARSPEAPIADMSWSSTT